MEQAREHTPMMPRQLAEHIRTFINDQRHTHFVQNRWLANSLEPVINTVYAVANYNLTPEMSTAVNAFRAAELQKQIEDKRNEASALERELAKVRAATS